MPRHPAFLGLRERATRRATSLVALAALTLCAAHAASADPAWTSELAGDGTFGDATLAVAASPGAVFASGVVYRSAGDGTFVPRGFLRRHDPRTGVVTWGVEIAPPGSALSCGALAAFADGALATGCGDGTGGYGVFVHEPGGASRWSAYFPSPGSGTTFGGLAVDAEGRVFVAATLRGDGDARIRVHAFSSAGQPLWTHDYAAAGGGAEASAVAADGIGGVVVAGNVTTAATWIDGLVVRVAPAGVDWSHAFGGPAAGGIDEAAAIAVAGGEVTVAGTIDRQTATTSDGIVLRLSLQGALAWQVRVRGADAASEGLAALALGPDGGAVVAGQAFRSGDASVPLVAAVQPDGSVRWVARGEPAFATPDRYVAVTSRTAGAACAAGSATLVAGSTASVYDCFDATGTRIAREAWSGGQGVAVARALAVDAHGDAVVGGSSANAGTGLDAFVLRYENATMSNGFE